MDSPAKKATFVGYFLLLSEFTENAKDLKTFYKSSISFFAVWLSKFLNLLFIYWKRLKCPQKRESPFTFGTSCICEINICLYQKIK